MDEIQNKKFKEFAKKLDNVMLEFSSLLILAANLYEDLSADAMIEPEDEKIANLKIVKKAIVEMTESAKILIDISRYKLK